MPRCPAIFSFSTRTVSLLIACLLLPASSTAAQPFSSARYVAVAGDAPVSNTNDPNLNPAALAFNKWPGVSLFASQPYGLRELRFGSATLTLPLSFGAVAVRASSLGVDPYRDTSFSLALGGALFPGSSRPIYVGLSGSARQIAISTYGTRLAYGLTAGYVVEIWPSLFWGFSYANLLRSQGAARLSRRLTTGMGYRVPNDAWILVSIAAEPGFPASLSAGIEYLPGTLLRLQLGMATEPDRISAGISIHTNRVVLGMAGERHSYLGWTPAVSVNLRLARQKES